MALTPGLNLPFGIQPVNAVPVDANYGPFATVSEANAAIPLALRYDGLTVQIAGSGNYYWTSSDLTDTGLIKKSASVTDLTLKADLVSGQVPLAQLPLDDYATNIFVQNNFIENTDPIDGGNF